MRCKYWYGCGSLTNCRGCETGRAEYAKFIKDEFKRLFPKQYRAAIAQDINGLHSADEPGDGSSFYGPTHFKQPPGAVDLKPSS